MLGQGSFLSRATCDQTLVTGPCAYPSHPSQMKCSKIESIRLYLKQASGPHRHTANDALRIEGIFRGASSSKSPSSTGARGVCPGYCQEGLGPQLPPDYAPPINDQRSGVF